MRNVLVVVGFFVVLSAVLCGVSCVSAGSPTPIVVPLGVRQVSTVEGKGVLGSLMIGLYPFTYETRWSGNGKLTLQYPDVPHVLWEGNFVVEPVVPEQRAGLEAEILAGRVAVRDGAGNPLALAPSR